MEESSVSFKATVNGLILIMCEEEDFESIFDQIEKKLASSQKFFKGASIGVKYRGRKLSEEEEAKIERLMTSKTGAEIKSFEEDTGYQLKNISNSFEPFFKGIEEGMTKFHRGTVRSGQLVSFKGNIVVIGDVNPGGQLEATGNVIVMGTLRGIVHAGADGNKEAVVAALSLRPTQLRIADVITRSPDEKDIKTALIPEMASIKDNMVYIERFLPQYK